MLRCALFVKNTKLFSNFINKYVSSRFLRAKKAYTPPEDTLPRLKTICQNVFGSDSGTVPVTDMKKKFELLTACHKEFDHYIPNSLLHAIETVNDVVEFYKTPVNTTTPLDMMKNINLPENVHVQYEYHRFHPGTVCEILCVCVCV